MSLGSIRESLVDAKRAKTPEPRINDTVRAFQSNPGEVRERGMGFGCGITV